MERAASRSLLSFTASPLSGRVQRSGDGDEGRKGNRGAAAAAAMGVMDKLKIFVVKEPVVAASCLIAGFGTHPPLISHPLPPQTLVPVPTYPYAPALSP